MTVRFVSARRRNPTTALVRGNMIGARVWTAANDNDQLSRAANDEAMLADTLRHFGNHGLNSAEVDALRALAAHDRGDDSCFAHWLSICGMVDRRLAEAIKRGATAKA